MSNQNLFAEFPHLPPAMPWTTKITRPITLFDGTELVTLGDAVQALINNFAGVEPASIEPTIALVVKADNSRKAADIDAATKQIELVLRTRKLTE